MPDWIFHQRKIQFAVVHQSQIARSDMHHPVSGINSPIHSVSVASHVSTHVFIHLSAHLCHHHHSHHPSLLHSRLKTYLFSKSFPPPYSFDPRLPSRSPDQTYHAARFIFSLFLFFSFFNFSVCPVWLTKLATCQLFTTR